MMSFAPRAFVAAGLVAASLLSAAPVEAATKIERVVSPGGIEAWLVNEASVPLVAMNFAFRGGASQDPSDKPGVSYLVSGLLDEGAGDLDAKAFQSRVERNAVELGFSAHRDEFRGSLRVLRDRKDEGFELLRLAVTAPRFDTDAIERVRAQVISSLRRASTDPNDIGSRLWWRTAFPDHPYGRPTNGTLESVPQISRDDLIDYSRRVLARDNLVVAVVGDIDAKTLAPLLDRIFGALPAKAELQPVPVVQMQGAGKTLVSPLDVPQSVVNFGGTGLARKDPDFIPAFVANHILGGGAFTSRLYKEVREKRGLAYSVSSYLLPLKAAALLMGSTQTSAERTGQAVALIEAEIARFAAEGPSAEELEKAKSYIIGSYALNFDTSAKIANLLVQVQLDELGIDYIDRRNALVAAVTLDDVRKATKRLLDGGILVTVVGREQDKAGKPGG